MTTSHKKILLSVTGMSPAVVTETLYALVTEKGFIPNEIRVITTLQGKNKVLNALCGIEGGRKEKKGALEEFIEDYGEKYGFSTIHFDESCIEVIKDSEEQLLSDIRSPEENALAADQIVGLVGKLCHDSDTQLHVSIAGGRKTMGFFMGYALSLYGREQDSLSHVLVSPNFENLRSFYYPKPYSYKVLNDKGEELDAQEAKVMLAEIPWVRLGLGISEELLNNIISYSDSVDKAQQLLDTPSLKFLAPMFDKKVQFGKQIIKLAPRGYAFLLSLTIANLEGWQYALHREEKRIQRLYLGIYDLLTWENEHMKDRLANFDDLKPLLSESCTDIRKKVQKAFSLGKKSGIAYIPSSSKGCYHLNIDSEHMDISEIKAEIAHLL